jgi:hypothetical protein
MLLITVTQGIGLTASALGCNLVARWATSLAQVAILK